VIVDPIAATTTNTGPKVYARLDENEYPKKIKVTDRQLADVDSSPTSTSPAATGTPNGTTSSHPAPTTTDPTRDTNHSCCFVTPKPGSG
jgi:hypothetical protein